MRLRSLALLVATLLGLTVTGLARPANAEFSASERAEIEQIFRDYLLENPDLILEALEVLEERKQAAQTSRQQDKLSLHRDDLEQDGASPVLGNPQGDVTIVEFFDYQCGYCKQASQALRDLLAQDGGVRLVMKEFPILGPPSLVAAQAALAAERQDGYEALHWALMANRAQLDETRIFNLAAEAGLDVDRLREDMADPDIQERLRHNYRLAEALEIRGTPAFIIGDRLLPGAVPLETLQEAVEDVRRGS
ncbi:MAG TPA: DsbA family protein [Kiloniellales bacterium]|jgi:protein-disulfide isomerase|nr:DsbA family protein [Kiloniellales bacterium]